MRTNAKRYLALMLAMAMLLSFAACGNTDTQQNEPQQTAQTPDPVTDTQQPQQIEEENYDGKLVSEGMMDIQYAEGFTIEMFKGGYRLLRDIWSEIPLLIVPEGMSVPTDLEEGTQVLQMPLTRAYISGSNIVAMADAIGASPQIKLVTMKADRWYIQNIADQMNNGATLYAGSSSKPDYEVIGSNDIQLAILNGYDEEEFALFHNLNICTFAEENTAETGLLARLEWIKCVGVLFGLEKEAIAYFDDQKAQIEAIQAEGSTGLTAGIGDIIISTNEYESRRNGDYQADQIRAAGGIYNLEDMGMDDGGVLNMTPEEFYLRFKDIDVLIWRKGFEMKSIEEVLAAYPAFADFKAYQTGRVYYQADHFTQSAAQTACIVQDYHTIFTSDDPNVTTDHIVKFPQTTPAE